MNCEFCNKEFASKSAVNHHKKTAKYCLEIQGKTNNNYICEYCSKNYSTKNYLVEHYNTCTSKLFKTLEDENKALKIKITKLTKINKELEIHSVENKVLKSQNSKLKKQNDKLEKELDNNKAENNLLKGRLSVLDKDHQIITNLAQQPKNTTTNTANTTNNILSIQTPLDFNNIDKLKNIIDEKYNDSYLFEGQKGIAKFAVEHILTDENGNLSYICTDPSRHIFKYKDSSGGIRKDVEAKKITNFLIDGGIQNKSSDMFIKLWSDKEGNVDGKKCSELLDKADAMMKLKNDNTVFKKELVYMTTKN
jgi:hypothetical protein